MQQPLTRSLLDLAASPLAPGDTKRLRALVDNAATMAQAFVALWSPETLVCITVVVMRGEPITWTMFPAKTEQAAHACAELLHAQAAANISAMGEQVDDAATAAIVRAARLN